MSEDNKQIARRVFEEAWNGRNGKLIDQLYDANSSNHDPSTPDLGQGPQGAKAVLALYTTAFPDLKFTILDLLAEGDRVVVRWTSAGTHKGQLGKLAPTNRATTSSGITIFRISKGKIIETWSNWDALGLMQQLGAVAKSEAA